MVSWLIVPRYTAVPSEAGGVTGVSGSVAPSQTPVVVNPEPAGAGVVAAGVVVDAAGDAPGAGRPGGEVLDRRGVAEQGSHHRRVVPVHAERPDPHPGDVEELASWAFRASEVGSSK